MPMASALARQREPFRTDVDESPLADPDLLKMPESGPHSETVDLLVLTVRHLLGEEVWVFRDLNWYPVDGGNAMAPDVMVLPRSAVESPPKSYRQDQLDGPYPLAVIEVASDTDTFAGLWAKCRRYQRLGTTAYVVVLDDEPNVFRLGPDDPELVSWIGRPVDELGEFSIDFPSKQPMVTLPDGTSATSNADFLASAERRIRELTSQLEALGVEPGTTPS